MPVLEECQTFIHLNVVPHMDREEKAVGVTSLTLSAMSFNNTRPESVWTSDGFSGIRENNVIMWLAFVTLSRNRCHVEQQFCPDVCARVCVRT